MRKKPAATVFLSQFILCSVMTSNSSHSLQMVEFCSSVSEQTPLCLLLLSLFIHLCWEPGQSP